jgi:hypothetical protein
MTQQIKSNDHFACQCGHAINTKNLRAEIHIIEKSFRQVGEKFFDSK